MKSCVNTMCTCLVEAGEEETEESAEKCRCQALTNYVASCLEENPDAQISDWRIATKCCKSLCRYSCVCVSLITSLYLPWKRLELKATEQGVNLDLCSDEVVIILKGKTNVKKDN